MKKNVTAVVLTMWKTKTYVTNLLKNLYDSDVINEVLLIDNNLQDREEFKNKYFYNSEQEWNSIFNHDKLKIIHAGENLYVNPAWNLGIENASNDWVTILNDDIRFNIKEFDKILLMAEENHGVIGTGRDCYRTSDPAEVNPNGHHPELRQHAKPEIRIYQPGHLRKQGWGCLIIVHKNNFQPIPDEIKLNCGDDWMQIYSLYNMNTHSEFEGLDVRLPRGQWTQTIGSTDTLYKLGQSDIGIWNGGRGWNWDDNEKKLKKNNNIKLSEKISVCVVTHIINVDTDPYMDNRMIEETILSAHKKLKLEDVPFYICFDSRLKKSHPELSNQYLENLKLQFKQEKFKNINVQVLDDTSELLRGNYIQISQTCNTPYMLFLEHDWEFKHEVDIKKIIKTFDNFKEVNYLRFQKVAQTEQDKYPNRDHWDYYYSNVPGSDKNIPMTRVSFFSGNPHIMRTKVFNEVYLPKILSYFPIERSKGTSHFEKEFYDIIRNDIANFGPEKAHEIWGTFAYDNIPCKQVVGHLGDWCRKK